MVLFPAISSSSDFSWRFFRAGGFDQVRLDTANELLHIGELDQKLWVALSCPVQGLEFDTRTLAFVDSDGDGHIRAGELISAVQWAGQRLKDPGVLTQQLPGVPLAAIRDDDEEGAPIAAAARELLSAIGAEPDGAIVTVQMAQEAEARLLDRATTAWAAAGKAQDILLLGEATSDAWTALMAVAPKVEDWFVRCRLAEYDEAAGEALNPDETRLAELGASQLRHDADAVASLPLAKVRAGAALPLAGTVNPAWSGRIADLRERVVLPLLGSRDSLSQDDWNALVARFKPYADWLAAKPDAQTIGASGIHALEKLAHYVRDLHQLANNFVSLRDFYTRQGQAVFQAGTLYLDGRSTELCVAVTDPERHAAMATRSNTFLVYCDCKRGSGDKAEQRRIAAAFTAGDTGQIMPGRNGVFYDRQGRDWDAVVTRIIDHPISLRQAIWQPYKRLGRFIAQQLQKFAASKVQEVDSKLLKTAPTNFDVAKFAGIFAAIGLALGAIGSALAAMVAGLFSLKWWQFPIAIAGVLLVISGPSVLLAWFKLRARHLGPLLDANGWAINAQARINLPFGASLTHLAELPHGAQRALTDPYAEHKAPWGWLLLVVLLGTVGGWFWREPLAAWLASLFA